MLLAMTTGRRLWSSLEERKSLRSSLALYAITHRIHSTTVNDYITDLLIALVPFLTPGVRAPCTIPFASIKQLMLTTTPT
jgi:hypothetical protein